MPKSVYLDYNATAPVLPQVTDGMLSVLRHSYGNPSATHVWGQQARRLVERARACLAERLSCAPDYIIFTSSATEANNQALRQPCWERVLIDATAHDSAHKALEKATYLPVLASGLVNLEILEMQLHQARPLTTLVSINAVNNETGVIQPLEAIRGLVKTYQAYLHVDAAQALGKTPISFQDSGADLMTLCAHKMGGPQGIGALIARESVALTALLRGGGQEKNRRSGSENLAAIHGWAEALSHMPDLTLLRRAHDQLEAELSTVAPDLVVFGKEAPRAPNVSNMAMPGVPNHTQVMNFDLEGFAVSAGSACSSGKVSISRVIEQMQVAPSLAQTAIRVSSGWNTKPEDLTRFANTWKKIFNQAHRKAS